MPGPRDIAPIVNAVREGTLSEEKLNESVERILRMLVQMPVMRSRQEHDIDSEAARKVAYQAAAEGIILLKMMPKHFRCGRIARQRFTAHGNRALSRAAQAVAAYLPTKPAASSMQPEGLWEKRVCLQIPRQMRQTPLL